MPDTSKPFADTLRFKCSPQALDVGEHPRIILKFSLKVKAGKDRTVQIGVKGGGKVPHFETLIVIVLSCMSCANNEFNSYLICMSLLNVSPSVTETHRQTERHLNF